MFGKTLKSISIALFLIILTTASQIQAQTCATAPVGLVSAYSGDGNALDARSRSNGTIQGNVTYAAGEVGQAFQLAGNNGDRVLVGNPTNLQLQNFTIEAWIKRSSSSVVTNSPNAGSPDGIFFAYGLGGYAFLIEQNTNKLGLSLVGTSQVLAPTLAITDTNWHHVAVTFAGGQTVFYVDGAADAPVSYNVNFSFTSNAAIGSRGDGQTDNVFFGAIDELAIYNRPLAAAEIQSIFNAGTTGKCKPLATYAPDNQVLWLAGDGDLRDASGNGNNGTYLSGTTAAFTVGKVGQGFQFDGNANSEINVTDSQSLRPTTAVTVEAWVNPSTAGTGAQSIVYKGNGSTAGGQPYSIFIGGSNHLVIVRVGNDSTFDSLVSISGIPANVYSHVAFTYDGTTIRIYINGVLDASAASSIGNLAQADTNVLWVGGLGNGFPFIGGLDEVGIYNRALSLSEIQSIANAGLAGKYKVQSTVPNNLVAWYAGDGDPNDLQGGNNAILQNGASYGNGKVGQGFQFDGADDQISIPHNANQNGGTNLTIEAWINPTSLAHGTTILQKRTSGNVGGYLLEPTQANQGGATNGLSFIIMIGGVYQTLNPANVLTANVWQHVAATYDGAFMRLYVNGAEVGNRAQTGAIDAVNTPVVIGRNAVIGVAFAGGIDEIALYNRALTANEIRDAYYAQSGGKYKAATNPTVSNKTKTGDAEVTFSNLTASGAVQETPIDPSKIPAIPINYGLTGLYYQIDTTGHFMGVVTQCFTLPNSGAAFRSMTNFNALKVLYLESGVWQDHTSSIDFGARQVCGQNSTMLPQTIVSIATTATIIIGGRVLTANGAGIGKIRVTLTDSVGNRRSVTTSQLGYYRFGGVVINRTYTVSVEGGKNQFDNPARIVTAADNISDLNFAAAPQNSASSFSEAHSREF